MSAALQFPSLRRLAPGDRSPQSDSTLPRAEYSPRQATPPPNFAFYRKRTERILRKYLVASMLVGRKPSIITEPMNRGWASHRVLETFEDSVIFVLDMEKCLDRLSALDRVLINRIVLQEYSEGETALLLNRSERNVRNRFATAVDRLTGILLDCKILRIPTRGVPCPEEDE